MNYIDGAKLKKIILSALKEDIGKKDITSELLIDRHKQIRAALIAKENFLVCGLDIAGCVFRLMDKKIKFKALTYEGRKVKKGQRIAILKGKARNILTAERVALNFLSLLSGIATKTNKCVEAVRPSKVKVMDTRKTIPCLRLLEKYAVRVGGGYNHRMKLEDMILIKDNHLKILGGIDKIKDGSKILKIKKRRSEIEVKNIKEFKAALKLRPDIIMLDNMKISDVKHAVRIRDRLIPKKAPMLEASGGIGLKNIKAFASSGIEMISLGNLTHSISSVDISLEII